RAGDGSGQFRPCNRRIVMNDKSHVSLEQHVCLVCGKREHTKHMLRLRHASQINGAEANEIVLLNSHDGTSSYQMLAGMFRFVCSNGLVCGDTVADVRVPHKGDVSGHVIE